MSEALVERLRKILRGTTPGPWRVIIDDDGNPLSGRPSVSASEELDCCIVHWDGFVQQYWRSARGDKEIHANAALISEAPELISEAADCIEALEREVKEAEKANRAMAQNGLDLANSWQSRAEAAERKVAELEKEMDEARADAKHWKANYHGLLSVSEEARLGEEIRTYERDFAAEKLANAEAERVVGADWINYRPLAEGEIIQDGDECLTDSHLGWQPAANTVGSAAPDPSYTAHRMYRRPLAAKPAVKDDETVVEALVKHMVQRFLQWKLPENFNPDGGIGFDKSYRSPHGPVGTNLFDATQADAMVRHMLEGAPAIAATEGRS